MTINATTAMTTISEKPISNMPGVRFDSSGTDPHHASRVRKVESDAHCATDLLRLLFLGFALDRLTGDLLRIFAGRRRLFTFRGLHAFLEALHCTAQVLADVAQLLGAEDQYDDEQDDQPVPDAQSTHSASS